MKPWVMKLGAMQLGPLDLSRMKLGRWRALALERYVIVRSLIGVAGALAVITAIITLADFVTLSRDVGVRARETTVVDIVGLTLLQSPSVILILAPFAFLFGVLAAFVGLNRRSELIAMRAAGVSAWRFILPAAVAAAVVGVGVVGVANPLASAMNAAFEKQRTFLMQGYLDEASKPIWLRQGDGRNQIIILASKRAPGDAVRLETVSMFVYGVDAGGALRFSRRIDAREARLDHGEWLLADAREGSPGQPAVTYAAMTVPSTLNERTALERFSSAQAVPFWSLPGVIARAEKAGFSAVTYRLQMQVLLATPLLYAAMSILAAAFSLRLMRLGGLAQLAASAVGLGFLFFFMSQLCGALGKAEVIPPLLAAWAPPLLALFSGLTLLLYTEDG